MKSCAAIDRSIEAGVASTSKLWVDMAHCFPTTVGERAGQKVVHQRVPMDWLRGKYLSITVVALAALGELAVDSTPSSDSMADPQFACAAQEVPESLQSVPVDDVSRVPGKSIRAASGGDHRSARRADRARRSPRRSVLAVCDVVVIAPWPDQFVSLEPMVSSHQRQPLHDHEQLSRLQI